MSQPLFEVMSLRLAEYKLGYLYRYEDKQYCSVDEYDRTWLLPLKLELHKYPILKKTPKGAWILYGSKKFVLLSARKKFACLTELEAIESFIRRKMSQKSRLQNQLDRAEKAMQLGLAMQRKLADELQKEETNGNSDPGKKEADQGRRIENNVPHTMDEGSGDAKLQEGRMDLSSEQTVHSPLECVNTNDH